MFLYIFICYVMFDIIYVCISLYINIYSRNLSVLRFLCAITWHAPLVTAHSMSPEIITMRYFVCGFFVHDLARSHVYRYC